LVELKMDEIILEMRNGKIFQSIPKEFQNNQELLIHALMHHHRLNLFSDSLRNNKKILLSVYDKLIQHGYYYMGMNFVEDLSDQLKDDENLLYQIFCKSNFLQNNILTKISQRLRENQEFIIKILKLEPKVMVGASDKIRNDVDFIIDYYKTNKIILLEYGGVLAENSEKLASFFLPINGRFLKFFGESVISDKQLVTLAVQQNGYAIEHASPKLKNDPEI
jgi:hypothetical protein